MSNNDARTWTHPALATTHATLDELAAEYRELQARAPLIVNFGGGTDSHAIVILLERMGIVPDLVIMADTGSEQDHTPAAVEAASAWLVEHGMPAITDVRRAKSKPSKTGPGYDSLEGNLLQNGVLPSLAYGQHGCSQKWKAEPMDAFLATWQPAVDAKARGERITKLVGYDATPKELRRIRRAVKGQATRAANGKPKPDDLHVRFRYPLAELGLSRDDSIDIINGAGIDQSTVGKSSCCFCPAMQTAEVDGLKDDELRRAIALEDRAQFGRIGFEFGKPTAASPNGFRFSGLRAVRGLWRRVRKVDGRPGSWREYAEQKGLALPEDVDSEYQVPQVPGVDLWAAYEAAAAAPATDLEALQRDLVAATSDVEAAIAIIRNTTK